MSRSDRVSESLRRIVVRGQPLDRGRQYGAQGRRLILRSIAHYQRVFEHRQQLEWGAAVERASRYEDSIGAFSPEILEEIRGIAEGAQVEIGSVLALNARSELMFTPSQGGTPSSGSAGECTSFALLPEVTSAGHTVIGQNWDWLPFAADTMILLEVHRERKPSFVSLTEAGLVAKIGCNAAGLGVCTNTLVSRLDDGRAGVPYHVILRGLLDAETINDAARTLTSAPRGFSGNYLVAQRSGIAFNAETTSGDAAGVAISAPVDGVIAHTNHFLRPDLARDDARIAQNPHSLFRLDSLERALRREAPAISVERIQNALRGHQGHPDGVCSHPDARYPELEQRATLASMIVDLDAGELWIAPGQPCATDYEWFNVRSIFENASELAGADRRTLELGGIR
jgi:isopenicillin-N N-acyltransferase-like protein